MKTLPHHEMHTVTGGEDYATLTPFEGGFIDLMTLQGLLDRLNADADAIWDAYVRSIIATHQQ
jgi:hypothetical protein